MYIPENIKAGLMEALRRDERQGDTPSVGPAFVFKGASRQNQLRKFQRNKKREVRPIKGTFNYFVTKGGVVIKIEGENEIIVPIMFKGRRNPYIDIKGKGEVQLIYVILDAFDIKYTPNDRIEYTANEFGHIQLNSIKVIPVRPKDFSSEDEAEMRKYNCYAKSNAANARGQGILNPVEVLLSLRINEFKCHYCATEIIPNDWHLDHLFPISKKGKNVFKNIVPSCPTCNKMKSDLEPQNFIKMCKLIIANNRLTL